MIMLIPEFKFNKLLFILSINIILMILFYDDFGVIAAPVFRKGKGAHGIKLLNYYRRPQTNTKLSPIVSGGRRVPSHYTGSQISQKYPNYWGSDIILNPSLSGRSRSLTNLWTKEGIIFLYSEAFIISDYHRCVLGEMLKLVRFYSCIPVYFFDISWRCARSDNPLDCARKPAEPGDEVDSYTTMQEEKVLQKMQSAKDYVMVLDEGIGCASHLGRQGGMQELWMERGCYIYHGRIIHEVIHALGYEHEQSRQDRDDYVIIYEDNIQDGQKHNFKITDNETFQDFGPYDFYSLMHYASGDFSKDPDTLPTILPKEKHNVNVHEMGEQLTLRMSDKIKIRAVTHCPGTTYEDHYRAVMDLQSTQTKYKGEHTLVHQWLSDIPCDS